MLIIKNLLTLLRSRNKLLTFSTDGRVHESPSKALRKNLQNLKSVIVDSSVGVPCSQERKIPKRSSNTTKHLYFEKLGTTRVFTKRELS